MRRSGRLKAAAEKAAAVVAVETPSPQPPPSNETLSSSSPSPATTPSVSLPATTEEPEPKTRVDKGKKRALPNDVSTESSPTLETPASVDKGKAAVRGQARSTKRRRTTKQGEASSSSSPIDLVGASSKSLGKMKAVPFPLLHLPDDCLIIVFESCTVNDLCNLSRCCRRLDAVSGLDILWRPIAMELYKPSTIKVPPSVPNAASDGTTSVSSSAAAASSSSSSTSATAAASGSSSSSATVAAPSSSSVPPLAAALAASLHADAGSSSSSWNLSAVPYEQWPTTLARNVLPFPTRGYKLFLANLSQSHCFRCGVLVEGSIIGPVGVKALELFRRRYCKSCQKTELISKSQAKQNYLVTDKQIATLRCVQRGTGTRSAHLYLRTQVEQLSLTRWGTQKRIDEEKSKRKPRAPRQSRRTNLAGFLDFMFFTHMLFDSYEDDYEEDYYGGSGYPYSDDDEYYGDFGGGCACGECW
ncbi:hypothetical protein HK102_000401 [Quaeritorhiza haematococci]|nr:hypothetical protein HK102_000401 [Quaeritorhiza haematococci]